ncbi:unnamed protein product [Pedinophyceae sp. YPF-701]|nr:unnamed protein product [Pedinophyceae sp. YPF-701]
MSRQDSKVFVGGISWETTGDRLRQYFENFGEVTEAFVSHDRHTGRPRGFGFVIFRDPSVADRVVECQHTIDRRQVEAKKALPRSLDGSAPSPLGSQRRGSPEESGPSTPNDSRLPAAPGEGDPRRRKIFVGGLPPSANEKVFREYFAQFGEVSDVVVSYDPGSNRHRGFGFVTFRSEAAVDCVFSYGCIHVLCGKQVQIKPAVPRSEMLLQQQRLNAAAAGGAPRAGVVAPGVPGNGFGMLLGAGGVSMESISALLSSIGGGVGAEAHAQHAMPMFGAPPQGPDSDLSRVAQAQAAAAAAAAALNATAPMPSGFDLGPGVPPPPFPVMTAAAIHALSGDADAAARMSAANWYAAQAQHQHPMPTQAQFAAAHRAPLAPSFPQGSLGAVPGFVGASTPLPELGGPPQGVLPQRVSTPGQSTRSGPALPATAPPLLSDTQRALGLGPTPGTSSSDCSRGDSGAPAHATTNEGGLQLEQTSSGYDSGSRGHAQVPPRGPPRYGGPMAGFPVTCPPGHGLPGTRDLQQPLSMQAANSRKSSPLGLVTMPVPSAAGVPVATKNARPAYQSDRTLGSSGTWSNAAASGAPSDDSGSGEMMQVDDPAANGADDAFQASLVHDLAAGLDAWISAGGLATSAMSPFLSGRAGPALLESVRATGRGTGDGSALAELDAAGDEF